MEEIFLKTQTPTTKILKPQHQNPKLVYLQYKMPFIFFEAIQQTQQSNTKNNIKTHRRSPFLFSLSRSSLSEPNPKSSLSSLHQIEPGRHGQL
jgi:hypothetical protein